jgi:hypothetical protein
VAVSAEGESSGAAPAESNSESSGSYGY